jgi:uncharacterized protein (TIGR02453 family)
LERHLALGPGYRLSVTFKGWGDEAIEFYDGLEEDNSKSYWQAHKDLYERAVRRPMEELLAELADEFGPGRMFRPYRDVRFSADKSPYKTAAAVSLDSGGYVQVSAAGLGVGRGMYTMASDQLERYRQAVSSEPSGLEIAGTVAAARAAGIEITARDRLKTAPRGYQKDHPRLDLLCLKGLIAWRQWPVARWLGTAKTKTVVMEFFRQTGPLQDWLDAHVGPSELPETRR